VVLVSVVVFAPGSLLAQSATTGAIAGVVRDASGAVLPGVTVEASSPALIEKLRTVVTDAQGRYQVIELRPGVYSVTFTLTGFSTVRRDKLELTTGFTATVDVDLRVGALEETITVSGASPVVDTQNVRAQQVYSREILDALPTGKTFASFITLTPGVSGAANGGVATRDVGGTQGEFPLGLRSHGSDPGLTSVDGIKTVSAQGGDWRRLNLSDLYTQEVVLETAGGSAEAWSGGVNINVVVKDGGNRFTGTAAGAFTGKGLDSNNLNDELRARGLSTYNEQKKIWDIGVGVGGPIKRDKLWFFATPRSWGNEYYIAGNYYNKTPHTLFYTPDLDRPALYRREQTDLSGRLTWQAASEHKLTFTSLNGYQCFCPFAVEGGTVSPEGAAVYLYKPQRLVTGTWSHPASNRLLLEAAVAWRKEGVVSEPAYDDLTSPTDISVLETSLNRRYGSHFANIGPTDYGTTPAAHWLTRASAAYVTGSHAFKTGITTLAVNEPLIEEPFFPYAYTFRNQIPISITQVASPHKIETNGMRMGVFAQDQWTLDRLTLNVGVRFDWINAKSPAQVRPGGVYVPEISFAETADIPNWKDINPRLGVAYNVFGNGKTAIKASLGRYELSNSFSLAFTRANSPVQALSVRTDRTWNDSLFGPGDPRTGNFVPDCDLTNRSLNGECGAFLNQAFGTPVVNTRYAEDVREGWGVSPYLWQGQVSVQQELAPGVALTAGYFRTWYGNIYVTDNTRVEATDFDNYCFTVPSDPRLPGGGGNRLCDLYDVKPAKIGQFDNLITRDPNRSQMYNGFDLLINARFGSGGILSGGLSTGRTVTDSCSTPDAPPQFCRTVNSWNGNTEIKLSGVYPLPWWGIQTSATIQNLPGQSRTANYVATNAEIAPGLGRNLAACPATGACNATATINLVEPFTNFESRGNQTDVRLSKIFRMSSARRLQANFDVFNAFNSADVLSQVGNFGAAWQRAVSILPGRLIKFSGQFSF
jgi:hypothetical protein